MTYPYGWLALDRGDAGAVNVFSRPLRVIAAREAADVAGALRTLQDAITSGHYVAGYLSYELGLVLEPALHGLLPPARTLPLLWFGEFAAPPIELDRAHADALWPNRRAYATPPVFEWDRAAYRQHFNTVMERIRAGDIYEANLSMRARFRFTGDPRALYGRLRAGAMVSHGAFVDDGEHQLLSLSPELFFTVSADGTVTAKPMKGTARRDPDPAADRALRDALRTSIKNRAENLMIVDLLRNDLGHVARTGTVEVPELFTAETYPTVHQLTSTVRARLRPGCAIGQMLQALFPCGSVTGAPKIRAMQIIRALEDSARGAYCGAIGFFAPDGSAGFNVAIRTIAIHGKDGELGVGGAIVADSDADEEYDECLLKARYFNDVRRPLALLETLPFRVGRWPRRDRHLQRMHDSALALGIPFDRARAARTLDSAVAAAGTRNLRVRLVLHEDGAQTATASELAPAVEPLRFLVAPERIDSNDPLNRYKTDWRVLQTRILAWARERGANEAVFLNERNEVSEGTYTNVFIEHDGCLFTPPVSSGALPGCLRAELLASGACKAVVTMPDVLRADRIYLGNSLRGLAQAVLQQAG